MKLPNILFSIMFNKVKYKHFVFLIAVSFLALSSINCTKLRESIDDLNSSIEQTNKGIGSLPTKDLTVGVKDNLGHLSSSLEQTNKGLESVPTRELTAEVKDNLSHLNITIQETNKSLEDLSIDDKYCGIQVNLEEIILAIEKVNGSIEALPASGLSVKAKKSLANLDKTIDEVNKYLKGLLNTDLPSEVNNKLDVLNETIGDVNKSLATLRIDGLSTKIKENLGGLNKTIDDIGNSLTTLQTDNMPSEVKNSLTKLNTTIGDVNEKLKALLDNDLPSTIDTKLNAVDKAIVDLNKKLIALRIDNLPPTIQKVKNGLENTKTGFGEIVGYLCSVISTIVGIIALIYSIRGAKDCKKRDETLFMLLWIVGGIAIFCLTVAVCVIIIGTIISLSFLFAISILLAILVAIIIFKVMIDVLPSFKILISDIITGKKHHKLINIKKKLDEVLEIVLGNKSNRFSKICKSFKINEKKGFNFEITIFEILTKKKERPRWELINNNESILPVSIKVTLVNYEGEDENKNKVKGYGRMIEAIYILEEIKFDSILVKDERHNYKILKINANKILNSLKTLTEPECKKKWYSFVSKPSQ